MAINIFKFLGLDPGESDNTVLAALLKEKQKWTNKMSQQPERAKMKLDQIKELEAEKQANPNMLDEHRKLYKNLLKEEKKAQEKALRDEARIFVVNGEIEETHLKALQKKNPAFTLDEILRILGARIKAKRRPRPVNTDKGKLIDRFIYKGITDELKIVGKADLYDFLGLRKSASIADIKIRNEELYTEITRGSISATGNAGKNLTGMIKTWLYTDEKRQDYDKTLNYEAFQGIARMIDQIASTGKLIQPGQYKMLVEECTKNGMSLEKAEGLIWDYAEGKEITIVDGGISSNAMTCRFCGSINDKNASVCKECGMPLVITCPKCGQRSTSHEELRCTKCGFNIGEMPKALTSLSQSETLLGFRNVDGAMQCYLEAERYWPGYQGLAQTLAKIQQVAPAAPSSLKVSMSGNTVNLEWDAAQTRYIKYEYIVVRKAGGAPNSPSDGRQIAVTQDSKVSDILDESGVNFYYAVYTRNGKSVSSNGAKSPKPVMSVANMNARDITLDIQETQIGFNFKKTHATYIEIYRDGSKIGSITGSTFIDNKLQTGRSYNYRFVAVYTDAGGTLRPSSGLEMTLSPIEMPKPVELQLSDSEKEATISWRKPAVGTLILFQDDKPFPYLAGNKVSLDGLRYSQVETVGTSVRIPKNWSGIRYYLPVTVQGTVGVAGEGVSITSIDSVRGVTAMLEGNKVIVKWQWTGVSAVRISYSIDGAMSKDVDVMKVSSSTPEYVILAPASSKSIAVSVMALVKTDKQTLTSAPERKVISLKAAKVEFVSACNVKRMLFLPSDQYDLTVMTDSALPCDLHILLSESVPPANLTNYRPAAVIKASQLVPGQSKTVRLEYKRMSRSAPLYFRLIAADRAIAKTMRVVSEIQKID